MVLSLQHRHNIPPPQTNLKLWLQTSLSEIRYSISLITFKLLDHPTSLWKNIFAYLKSLPRQKLTHFPSSCLVAYYPVFHVSMLELSTLNMFSGHEPTPGPQVILDREPEYKISEILDSKIDKHRKCELQYLVY